MRSPMAWMLVALLGAGSACGPRQAEVRTAPTADNPNAPAVDVTNTLTQDVNVYVTTGGTDMFVRRVGANATLRVPVQGVASGSVVTLKAVTADNRQTFTRGNVTLSGTVPFRIP
jgi:hypothetical protein